MSTEERSNGVLRWDAGDAGCGRLIMELQRQLRQLAPGASFEVTARDPAAWIDLPAWCRMSGHALVSESHPVYVIRKKVD